MPIHFPTKPIVLTVEILQTSEGVSAQGSLSEPVPLPILLLALLQLAATYIKISSPPVAAGLFPSFTEEQRRAPLNPALNPAENPRPEGSKPRAD